MDKPTPNIKRVFRDIPNGKLTDDQEVFSYGLGWSHGSDWDDLLKSKRLLIVSEAGAGKTFECRSQQEALWSLGEPAFFLELAELGRNPLRDMLSKEEEERFDAWHGAQSDVATFFLDSIDELKLSLGSFEQALKRLAKALAGQLRRARIIITTRPIPIDASLIRRTLPIPIQGEDRGTGDAFADVAMNHSSQKPKTDGPKDWRNVVLMPLSEEQIRQMAL